MSSYKTAVEINRQRVAEVNEAILNDEMKEYPEKFEVSLGENARKSSKITNILLCLSYLLLVISRSLIVYVKWKTDTLRTADVIFLVLLVMIGLLTVKSSFDESRKNVIIVEDSRIISGGKEYSAGDITGIKGGFLGMLSFYSGDKKLFTVNKVFDNCAALIYWAKAAGIEINDKYASDQKAVDRHRNIILLTIAAVLLIFLAVLFYVRLRKFW